MKDNNKKSMWLGNKRKGLSVLPIIFSGILAGGSLAGSGVAIWQVAKNYKESPEFTKSLNGRVKIDPAASLDKTKKHTQTKEEAEEIVKQCAENFSRWLKDNGQKNYDVSYEVTNEKIKEYGSDEEQYYGYLSANFEVTKVTRKNIVPDEEDEKIDNDPYLSFFGDKSFNSNEKTLVYRWYMPTYGDDQESPYTIIPFRDVFTIPKNTSDTSKTKVINDKDGKPGVLYHVDESVLETKYKTTLSKIYKNLKDALDDSKKEEEDKPDRIKHPYGEPRLYIVNNLEGLYNEVNYHICNWWVSGEGTSWDYTDIYKDSDYADISEEYTKSDWKGEEIQTEAIQTRYHLQSVPQYGFGTQNDKLRNADVFNYVDDNVGTIDANFGFVSKYITDIVTKDNIDDFMPEKITDDYKNETETDEPKINYFWYNQDSKDQANKYLNSQVKYGFAKADKRASIVDINFENLTSAGQEGETYDRFKENYNYTYIEPTFSDTIFGGSHLVGILSLGFLIFLIVLLIILAALYRTTGVFGWICMMFALSMTLLIATIGSTAITMSLFFGLFTIAIAGFIAAITICERMRRRLNSREDSQVIIKKTFKKSLLPVMDISVIALIFGVCFTYIAPISLNPLGLALIIGAFAIFICEYLLNGLLHVLFFNNQIMVNRFNFFGKPSNVANEALYQSNMVVPSSMDATRLELQCYSTMSKNKIDATGKKAMVAIILIGLLLIASIVLFNVLGFTSSNMFHTQNCLAIKFDGDIFAQAWWPGLDFVSYKHTVVDEQSWWYFYTNANNLMEIAKNIEAASSLKLYSDILVQSIIGSTNQDILNFALISILVGTSISSVYGAIRYNWIAFVPMLLGAFGIPLIALGIASASQVKFDQFVVMGYVLTIVINTIICAGLLGNINDSWSRKDAYNKAEFKYIINVSLLNSWTYIWTIAIAYAAFIISFGLTAPLGLISLIAIIIIGGLLTLIIAPVTIAFMLYQFAKIRNKVLNKMVERNKKKVVINYDDIDEQGIEGINKFTKHIPIAKEPDKSQGEK